MTLIQIKREEFILIDVCILKYSLYMCDEIEYFLKINKLFSTMFA